MYVCTVCMNVCMYVCMYVHTYIHITISKDDAPVTYTDHKLVFRALKVKDIDRRLSDWKRLINQGRLADPAVTNKKCSNAVLSNLKVGDHVHRFVIKGRFAH